MSLAVLAILGQAASAQSPSPLPPIEIHFSPNGDCTATILRELAAAKSSVLVQAYWFTSVPIAKGLAETHKRDVKVQDARGMISVVAVCRADPLVHLGVALA